MCVFNENLKPVDTEASIFVSVCMITYNHESYIHQAIEGVLTQNTTFPYKLVIGEDYSADGTRKICQEYANLYPDKIDLLPSSSNLGMQRNFSRTLNVCTGKYIALCEGDDYWTDPMKLQKQIDILENENHIGKSFKLGVYRSFEWCWTRGFIHRTPREKVCCFKGGGVSGMA